MTGLSRFFAILGLAVGLTAFAEAFGTTRASKSFEAKPSSKNFNPASQVNENYEAKRSFSPANKENGIKEKGAYFKTASQLNSNYEASPSFSPANQVYGDFEASPSFNMASQLNANFPWMAQFSSSLSSKPFCGGSLINSKQVITSASCKINKLEYVRIGHGDGSIVRRIKAVKTHPDYNPNTLQYDIAIVTLRFPVKFSSAISPICLPSTVGTFENELATIASWETMSIGGSIQTTLQLTEVAVTTQAFCASFYGPALITPQVICADKVGKNACQGIAGEPLLFQASPKSPFELIGVQSWGIGCAAPDKPGIYARVTEMMSFINEYAPESSLCAQL